jgi:spermidine synthase
MLDTTPFYLNCRQRLSRNGLMAVNLLDRRRGVAASADRIRAAFDNRVLLLPSCEAGNTIALAATGDAIEESFAELRQSAQSLKALTGLNLAPTLARYFEMRGGGLALVL